uniref:hypothetical protein n=1 Tax=Candidatus Collinsella stercoripullorum TaxID=2838522 RepID=UPI0022E2456C
MSDDLKTDDPGIRDEQAAEQTIQKDGPAPQAEEDVSQDGGAAAEVGAGPDAPAGADTEPDGAAASPQPPTDGADADPVP